MNFEVPPLSCFYRTEEEQLITQGLKDVHDSSAFFNTYELGEIVGRGACSVVRCCYHKGTKEELAVKIIDKESTCIATKRLRDEIKVLMRVKHRSIVVLKDVYESQREIFLVMERALGGELFDRIAAVGILSERDAAELMANVLLALEYLHSQNVIHRDIKPENLLLSGPDSVNVKLSDFGIAKILEDAEEDDDCSNAERRASKKLRAYTSCGTDYYIAPEILKEGGYDSKVDLWSLGVVLYILLCGFPPFTVDDGMESVYEKIKAGDVQFPEPYWSNVSKSAKSLVKRLLTVDPEQRISAEEALEHVWIRGRTLSTSQEPLDPVVLQNMKQFNKRRRLS